MRRRQLFVHRLVVQLSGRLGLRVSMLRRLQGHVHRRVRRSLHQRKLRREVSGRGRRDVLAEQPHLQSKLPAVRGIPALVLAACAAAPTQTVQVAATPSDAGSSSPDASAEAAVAIALDASADVAAVATIASKPVAEPWCNERYDVLPCVFRVFGACFLRDKGSKPSEGYAYWSCPSGSPPAFQDKPRACGRRPNEPIVPRQVLYSSADKAKCNAIETRWANVLNDERACKSDDDCVVIHMGCFRAPLNKATAALPKYADQPCGNPASGMCAPQKTMVRCQSGCCLFDGPGPSAFGTVDPAYPTITPP
jgi:hypothetical protein